MYEGQISLVSDSLSEKYKTNTNERGQKITTYKFLPAETRNIKIGEVRVNHLSFGTALDKITSMIFSKAYFKTDSIDERTHASQEYRNLQEYLNGYFNTTSIVYKPATKDDSRTVSHSCIWIIDQKSYQLTEVIFKTDKEIKKTVALLTFGIYQ